MSLGRGWLTPFALVDSLHLGGGITDENALQWLDAGAEKVRGVLRLEMIAEDRRITGDCHLLPVPQGDVRPRAPATAVRKGREAEAGRGCEVRSSFIYSRFLSRAASSSALPTVVGDGNRNGSSR